MFKLLKLAHEIKYDDKSVPKYFGKIYQAKLARHLRNALDYEVPFYRTKTGQKRVDFVIAKVWNSLPLEIKQIQNKNIFRRKIKSHIHAYESTT